MVTDGENPRAIWTELTNGFYLPISGRNRPLLTQWAHIGDSVACALLS